MRKAIVGIGALICVGFGQAQEPVEPEPLPARVSLQVDALIEQALVDTVGLQFVEDLTTEVGQRLAGSQAERRAREWAVSELETLGFRNVRIEDFQIPFWSRVTDTARIVSPAPQELVISALGGSASTPEDGLEAEIVRYTSLDRLENDVSQDPKGRIVFIDEDMFRTQTGAGYGLAVRKRSACASIAAEKGAVACLIRSVGTQSHRLAHTGIMARPEGEATGALPAAALSAPDADQLARLLERGPVTLHLNIQTETLNGVPSGNVIAEVVGQRTDEIILLGVTWTVGISARVPLMMGPVAGLLLVRRSSSMPCLGSPKGLSGLYFMVRRRSGCLAELLMLVSMVTNCPIISLRLKVILGLAVFGDCHPKWVRARCPTLRRSERSLKCWG